MKPSYVEMYAISKKDVLDVFSRCTELDERQRAGFDPDIFLELWVLTQQTAIRMFGEEFRKEAWLRQELRGEIDYEAL